MIVDIDGKKIGFRFTILTMRDFCELRKCKFSEYDKQFVDDPAGAVLDLLTCANNVHEKGAGMTVYEMDEVIESMTNEQLQSVMDEHAAGFISFIDKFSGSKKK